MDRTSISFLLQWLNAKDRKPLILRGARQVGKTWLVRHFAESQGLNLIEINFEKPGSPKEPFAMGEPKKIVRGLEDLLGISIDPKKSLLFLDEIQALPSLYPKLRWFAEDMPELAVIATGSLLEFALKKHEMSMPVGRVNFMYLEPFSFEEFLLGLDKGHLVRHLKSFTWQDEMPQFIHEELIKFFKEYIMVGGMPAAITNWVALKSINEIGRIHANLIDTYKADMYKYSGRIDPERLEEVLAAVPRLLGEKFVYAQVNKTIQAASIKQALSLLCLARVCHKVQATSANGLPLGAETNDRFQKVILLDVGLCSSYLNLSYTQLMSTEEIDLINKGGIAEQVTGQLLRTIEPLYKDPSLYYWIRSDKKSNAEIDYVIQHRGSIIPIEVKAGTTGTMKSLHLFMNQQNLTLAVRLNSQRPRKVLVEVKDSLGNPTKYELRSLPLYLTGELPRLLD